MNIKRKDKELSLGFTTASGSSINVSNKALSKAKELFTDELTEIDNYEDTCEIPRKSSNVGFQTASGQPIDVSSKALTKAKTLLEERIDEFKGQLSNVGNQTASGSQHVQVSREALPKTKTLFQYETDEFKGQLPNLGFRTASGQSVDITNEALSKAKILFQEEVDQFNGELPNVGFRTASGQNVKISMEALKKAKTFFEDDIDEFTRELSNVGFQTASGQNVKISTEALKKAKTLFEDDTDEFTRELSDVGFQTASGQNVKISKDALSKARTLFEDDTNEFEVELSNVKFETVNSQNVKVTNEAQTNAKTIFQREISQIHKNNSKLARPLQKRKINDLDDNVPLNRQAKPNQFKKLRFSNEIQVPKPVHNNATDIKDKENEDKLSVSTHALTSGCHSDNLNANINEVDRNVKSTQIVDNSLISHEITASAVALLADERDSEFSEQWLSPSEIKENDETATVPSSPVIGGQFVPRKRKSAGGRKRVSSNVKNKNNKLVHANKSKEIYDDCARSDQCIEDKSKHSIEQQKSIDEPKKCDGHVANEYGDTQLILDFIDQSTTILEKRVQAALAQDKQITLKQRNKPKPTISKLYFHKKSNANNRVSWMNISKGNKPIPCTYEELIERKLPPEISDITSNNAVAYKFRCTDFYGHSTVQNNIDGIKVEDGACLILDENGYAGISEIKRSFLASPGVDPSLLPDGWVENHYKWIVWKLASIDRIKLGSVVLPRALIPDRVMMELKYRYDREIDRSERSALRKILEKDDVPSKRMILCVSSIAETQHDDSNVASGSPTQLKAPSKKLVVTDGWYSVQACIDQAMIKNIVSGKVKEGTKLLTYGAELLNCDQGYPPLEAPESVCLKLHTNSTRRARWDMKLGYVAPTGPICVKLRTVCPSGGLVGKIKVAIARVYPLLYHEKTSAGESIFRNARCEEKANLAYEKECRSMIEAFYAKAEKYFYGGNRKNDTNTDSIDLVAYEWNEDCEKLSKEEFLSEHELQQLKSNCRVTEERFRQKLESRLQESLPPPRQVTSLLKIRIIDEEKNAILSVWSPSEEITDILKEGNYISISNVMPSMRRGSELQLTASRSTIFRRLNVSNINYLRRTYTALCDINMATFAPAYGEFDTVGIVTCIRNEPYGMKNFEAVYLAYPYADSQSAYLSILFWQGISFHGYAEILTVGSFVACSNLEWRRAASWNIPIAYCTERTTFTRNPRQKHLQQPFVDLKRSIKDVNTYIETCTVEITEEIQKKSMTRMSDQYVPDRSNIDKVPPNDNVNSDGQSNSSAYEDLPGCSLTSNQPAKSAAIQKRLEKLQYYGTPPSLSPIVLRNSSKRVSLEFKSPLKSTDEKREKIRTSLDAKYVQNTR